MREILFRGKASSGKWVYGNYAEATHSMMKGRNPHKAWIISGFASNGGWIAPLGRHAVDEDAVGQYTDFTDDNGAKVFEGDILKAKSEYCDFYVYVRVYFINGRYCVGDNGCDYISTLDTFILRNSEITIAGNMHDNPELLKGESK